MNKRVAIFLHGQIGDILEASSALYYRNELWGEGCEITWFIQNENRDVFKHNPYLKLIPFPHGYGIPASELITIYKERIEKDKKDGMPEWFDLSLLKADDNTLDLSKKHLFELVKDFDVGYYPAPHQMSAELRHGLEYSNCSRKVFRLPLNKEYHPVLYHSDEERLDIVKFLIPHSHRKKILVETFAGSGQSKITENMIRNAMELCELNWGPCSFIFVSHKFLNGNEQFPENWFSEFVVSAAHFTVRQCALFGIQADLLLSVSSGVTCALSSWGIPAFPALQYCGSAICGTKELANGEMIQVFSDEKTKEAAEAEYKNQLVEILNKIK